MVLEHVRARQGSAHGHTHSTHCAHTPHTRSHTQVRRTSMSVCAIICCTVSHCCCCSVSSGLFPSPSSFICWNCARRGGRVQRGEPLWTGGHNPLGGQGHTGGPCLALELAPIVRAYMRARCTAQQDQRGRAGSCATSQPPRTLLMDTPTIRLRIVRQPTTCSELGWSGTHGTQAVVGGCRRSAPEWGGWPDSAGTGAPAHEACNAASRACGVCQPAAHPP